MATYPKLLQHPPANAVFCVVPRGVGTIPLFCVRERWSLNLYSARGEIVLPDRSERIPLRPGMALLMPPGTARRFTFTSSGKHRVVHFSVKDANDCHALHRFICGQHRRQCEQLFDDAVASEETPRQLAGLWHLLWTLDELEETPEGTLDATLHPALQRSIRHIATNLSEPLRAAEIAKRAEVSHNHLTRLFRHAFQNTIQGYIRRQRMTLAKELLAETDMPIKAVAAEVGIPDAQLFNKTVRRHFGHSPSALRSSMSEGII